MGGWRRRGAKISKESNFCFVYFVYIYTTSKFDMQNLTDIKRPTKQEQEIAIKSYRALSESLERLTTDNPEIEIEETEEKVVIPLRALKLLAKILKATSEGKPISIIPHATEMTTQAAAELLGCSRPHLVKLLEAGEIPFTKIGKHRRVKFEDVVNYKERKRAEREELLKEIMQGDEELGLYDS
jgi:excisionase family DNA binding protein